MEQKRFHKTCLNTYIFIFHVIGRFLLLLLLSGYIFLACFLLLDLLIFFFRSFSYPPSAIRSLTKTFLCLFPVNENQFLGHQIRMRGISFQLNASRISNLYLSSANLAILWVYNTDRYKPNYWTP